MKSRETKPNPITYQEILELAKGDKEQAIYYSSLIDGIAQIKQGVDLGRPEKEIDEWKTALQKLGIDLNRIP